ncbi:hypothetical protein CCACVL1_20922 [Corchorus capsularis]|uniref:Uncharacterized protein n=1 Tax=Corchorus capsularis TaxID=210143 RepID=A0A1R3H995_COCAP|nr:hypothetical protein CCACVL1_20922 [Corchorus capsularis]
MGPIKPIPIQRMQTLQSRFRFKLAIAL